MDFSAHLDLAGHNLSEDLISQLEKRVFAIERLDWEIGPGRNAPNMFALSPHGDHELLQITRNIVAKAPELDGWEFYPTKPPREWNLVFDVVANGKDVEIDAKLWEFVVYRIN